VWLGCSTVKGAVSLRAFATGKIVRGLLALMFEPLQGVAIADVNNFNAKQYLDSLGLGTHLSESRGNGLTAVMESITVTLNNKIA
jgi:cysteine desulfurase/selenocysteine lyase